MLEGTLSDGLIHACPGCSGLHFGSGISCGDVKRAVVAPTICVDLGLGRKLFIDARVVVLVVHDEIVSAHRVPSSPPGRRSPLSR
jgi:hypothetical protein